MKKLSQITSLLSEEDHVSTNTESIDETTNFKSWSDDKLVTWLNQYWTDEPVGYTFGMQLKIAAAEARSRKLKLTLGTRNFKGLNDSVMSDRTPLVLTQLSKIIEKTDDVYNTIAQLEESNDETYDSVVDLYEQVSALYETVDKNIGIIPVQIDEALAWQMTIKTLKKLGFKEVENPSPSEFHFSQGKIQHIFGIPMRAGKWADVFFVILDTEKRPYGIVDTSGTIWIENLGDALKKLTQHVESGDLKLYKEDDDLEEAVSEYSLKLTKADVDKGNGPMMKDKTPVLKTNYYDILRGGKKVGELITENYLGEIYGELYNKELPDISEYGSRGYNVSESSALKTLDKFLKSPAGIKWMSSIKEEDDLEEASISPQQKMDMDRVNAGAMKRDDYDKKWKKGKYRPKGNPLAGPGGLYKNLLKKEDLDEGRRDDALEAEMEGREEEYKMKIAKLQKLNKEFSDLRKKRDAGHIDDAAYKIEITKLEKKEKQIDESVILEDTPKWPNAPTPFIKKFFSAFMDDPHTKEVTDILTYVRRFLYEEASDQGSQDFGNYTACSNLQKALGVAIVKWKKDLTSPEESVIYETYDDFVVRYRCFSGKDGRIVTKDKSFKTLKAMAKWMETAEDKVPNFYEIVATAYPTNHKPVDESVNISEVLDPNDEAGVWIDDFVNSDNPKFDGKSKKERIKMALGAWYAAQKKESVNTEVDEDAAEKTKTNDKIIALRSSLASIQAKKKQSDYNQKYDSIAKAQHAKRLTDIPKEIAALQAKDTGGVKKESIDEAWESLSDKEVNAIKTLSDKDLIAFIKKNSRAPYTKSKTNDEMQLALVLAIRRNLRPDKS